MLNLPSTDWAKVISHATMTFPGETLDAERGRYVCLTPLYLGCRETKPIKLRGDRAELYWEVPPGSAVVVARARGVVLSGLDIVGPGHGQVETVIDSDNLLYLEEVCVRGWRTWKGTVLGINHVVWRGRTC